MMPRKTVSIDSYQRLQKNLDDREKELEELRASYAMLSNQYRSMTRQRDELGCQLQDVFQVIGEHMYRTYREKSMKQNQRT